MVFNVSDNPTLGPTRMPRTLPPNLKAFSAANASLAGLLAWKALPKGLWYLDVSRNSLKGPLPGGGDDGVLANLEWVSHVALEVGLGGGR